MRKLLLLLAMSGTFAHAATPQPVKWTGTWAASPLAEPTPSDASNDPAGNTFRDIVHISLGGKALRLKISNEFGASALTLGNVHVALSAGKDTVQPSTDHAVTFDGKESISIPAGAMIVSDPVAMPVAAFADLSVSLFVPSQPGVTLTYHELGVSTNYIATGNLTTAPALDGAKKVLSWYLLKGVDVDAGPNAATVVTLGDSITDGAGSTVGANQRWPDVLATRLHANPATVNIGVLNEGISGNRLLHDLYGQSALARLDRDVLTQTGVKYVIVLLGINDIGLTSKPPKPTDRVTSEEITFALRQLAVRAHARGLKIYAATLTPYKGAKYEDAAGLKMREEENTFIRTSGIFDGVIDFDKATQDPAHPDTFLPLYDRGDRLHPSSAGHKAMADSIDLKIFR